MKKITLYVVMFLLFTTAVYAQNTFPSSGSAGIGTVAPDASSALEIKSTTQGILIPRMTKGNRDAIINPIAGLMIYQTNNTPGFYYYTGTAWVSAKGANNTLSNLSVPTAVNQVLRPEADNTIDLGASSFSWKDLYVDGVGYLGGGIKLGNFTGTPQAGMIRWTGTAFEGFDGSSWSALAGGGGGTVTQVNTGTGLTGGPIITSGTISLATSGVIAASYGSATQVPKYTVDATGRITAASNITIAGTAPGGNAGGSLAGTYPNPLIATGVITSGNIADNTITSADIGDATILNADISPSAAIAYSKLNLANSIVAGDIVNGTITSADLTASGVTAGTYGSASLIPVITVDAAGRITAASAIAGGSGANNSLSNLAATSINISLVPNTNKTLDLGTASLAWKDIYAGGKFYFGSTRFMHNTGNAVTFVGNNSGNLTLTGAYNTAIGASSGAAISSGIDNAFLGDYSGNSNSTGSYNTFAGSSAGQVNTVGASNTFVGAYAGALNKTGYANVFVGRDAGYSNVSSIGNVAIGDSAGRSNINSFSVFIGYKAGMNNGGAVNTMVGGYSGTNNTGIRNTFFGFQTGQLNVDGGYNSFFGTQAGANNKASYNSFFGQQSGYYNTTGTNNAFFGEQSGYKNDGGNSNSFFGTGAGYVNVNGSDNAFFGYEAGQNTTSSFNSFFGSDAGASNSFAVDNAFFGYYSGEANTEGSNNSFLGSRAGAANLVGNDNTFVGTRAGNVSTSDENSFFGSSAGVATTTGHGNTFLGKDAGLFNTTGSLNTSVGYSSGGINATGHLNTSIGFGTGFGNSDGCTFLGEGVFVNADGYDGSTGFGQSTVITASNQVRIGKSTITSIGGYVNWSNISDGRFKKNIKQDVKGLDFINKLKPVTYSLDITGITNFVNKNASTSKKANDKLIEKLKSNDNAIAAKEKIVYSGFVAQDVEKAAKQLGYDFSGVDAPKNDNDLYGLRYSDFVVPLVKAVQELSAKNDAKDSTIAELKKQNADFQKQFNDLKTLVLQMQQKQEQCSPCSAVNGTGNTYSATIPADGLLLQNVPNPFEHTTSIEYTLPATVTHAQIVITDKNGKTLLTKEVSGSGKGRLNVDASILSSGAYNYSLLVNGKVIATKQMVLAK